MQQQNTTYKDSSIEDARRARLAHVIPMTNRTLRTCFPGMHAGQIRKQLDVGKWKPSAYWLDTTGARYGRLLVMSDMHVGAGYNRVTGAFANSDDFTAAHEEDFHHMLRRQWAAAERDGKPRTLVFNGDTFEFMQTERVAIGEVLDGHADELGPLNTPTNLEYKLDAIYDGHSGFEIGGCKAFFNAWAEHLVRGHRIVLIPGNHDHQLLNGRVRGRLVERLTATVAEEILALGNANSEDVATTAKTTMARFEFHPWFFVVGDVMARHGHETDGFNNFRRSFCEYYHSTLDSEEIPGAAGDAMVKAFFNRAEAMAPWADNTASKSALARVMLASAWWVSRPTTSSTILAALLGPRTLIKATITLGKGVRYVLTRDGRAETQQLVLQERTQLKADIDRYVSEFGLLDTFNQLQPHDRQFTHQSLVETLFEYETEIVARPFATFFHRGQGFARRVFGSLFNLGKIRRAMDAERFRVSVTKFLHGTLSVRYTYGHDHMPRIDQNLIVEDGQVVRMLDSLDTETWINADPTALTKSTGLVSCERRAVLVVDFDDRGSHAKLMHFDAARAYTGNAGLQRKTVLEDTAAAMFR